MKKLLLSAITFLVLAFPAISYAQITPTITPGITVIPITTPGVADQSTLLPCTNVQGTVISCPPQIRQYYDANPSLGEKCVDTYASFIQDPRKNHYWVEDPKITAQWRADERARQFIYWVLNKNALDDNPTFRQIWSFSSNIAYVFILLVVAVMGLRYIIGQRLNFQTQLKIWPSVLKIGGLLLYIALSFSIIVTVIQLSEIVMRFFIDNVGGRNLFNIYGVSVSDPKNYSNFVGCRDLNIRVNESADTELFLLNATNVTYYVMGVLLILRKIVLWFMMFLSPFLAILLPFILIRNVGIIWIGVFFQWLFYGPLVALFLGAMVKIWTNGIPFIFDFSRFDSAKHYIYPTAISILYGGPAQVGERGLSSLNNGNYVDTFVEYIITLIMLWAVMILPWWLLRIFRDYCCDGINAMKNILLSMYDQTRGGLLPPPSPGPLSPFTKGTTIKTQKTVEVQTQRKLETIEEIRKIKTEEISKNLNLTATKLTDVAHFEINKQLQQETVKNIEYLKNPAQAQTPQERQKYMNIRTELFNRAIKEDKVARQILSATSTSQIEQRQKKEELIRTSPQVATFDKAIAVQVKLPQEKISSINNSLTNVISNNTVIESLTQTTHSTPNQIQQVMSSFTHNIHQPAQTIISKVVEETHVAQPTVIEIIKTAASILKNNKELLKQVAEKEQISEQELLHVIETQEPLFVEPEKHVEKSIPIPASISIEDYEEVKSMWVKQYEKGEVPVSENMKTRRNWIDQDIVYITNTLNKLLSADEQLRLQGLDEVGYILPIFMINNLKGEELLVYLKAKLEAAKSVKEALEKEEEITAKLKGESEENLVEVDKPAAQEEAKTMEMKEELPTPEENKPDSQS